MQKNHVINQPVAQLVVVVIIIIIIITSTMFTVLSSIHKSFLEFIWWMLNSAEWLPTLRPSQMTWALGYYGLHPLSPEADTHFTIPQRVEGWVNLGAQGVRNLPKLADLGVTKPQLSWEKLMIFLCKLNKALTKYYDWINSKNVQC